MLSFAIAVSQSAPLLDPTAPSAAWAQAASTKLAWDVVRHRPATEPTNVHIASSGGFIFVRFDATQREPIAATQRSNGVGQGNDDAVWVDLWPNGTNGYAYEFQATPNGTHYQTSSENAAYEPAWESHGAIHDQGYTVTMKIPLAAIRGVHTASWRGQFVRYIHATGEEQVWSFDSAQTLPDDVARAGALTMPVAIVAVDRPRPRIDLYGLAAAGSRTLGGATSRSGADLSLPITQTASFYATLHPDFSNVELDQQSISPSVYQRFYSEVRPFFTQGSSLYNKMSYVVTNSYIESLYTPAIPTPRDGYAIEGKQGEFSFGGFDALGNARNDNAAVLDYMTPDSRWQGTIQRSAVETPTIHDNVTNGAIKFTDLRHATAYLDYGNDAGSNVIDKNQGQWYDAGGIWRNDTFLFAAALRKVGAFYNPVDGFIFHPGIAGYGLYAAKIVDFPASSRLVSAGVSAQIDRYQGPQGGSAQSDNQFTFDVLTKSALDLQLNAGSDYWRFGNVLTPISQNAGFVATYHSGLQTNNPNNFPGHGSSATPTSLSYSTGRYGDGRLDTWLRTSTIRAGDRGSISIAVDNTSQWLQHSPDNIQWFESISYAEQISRNSSIAVGLRQVFGEPPVPSGGGNCIGRCSNIAFAYHTLMKRSELYIAYGDPNTLTTVPQTIVKWIFYAGADKGT